MNPITPALGGGGKWTVKSSRHGLRSDYILRSSLCYRRYCLKAAAAAAARTNKAWEAGVSHLYLRRLRQEDCQKFEANLVYTVRFTPATKSKERRVYFGK